MASEESSSSSSEMQITCEHKQGGMRHGWNKKEVYTGQRQHQELRTLRAFLSGDSPPDDEDEDDVDDVEDEEGAAVSNLRFLDSFLLISTSRHRKVSTTEQD